MKIKVIDLLVKMANDKNYKPTFKFEGSTYKYNKDTKYYEPSFMGLWKIYMILNDEVEIIEELKKIKYPILHKTAPSETTGDQMPNWRNLIDCNFEYLNKTICQLIDEINNLKEK